MLLHTYSFIFLTFGRVLQSQGLLICFLNGNCQVFSKFLTGAFVSLLILTCEPTINHRKQNVTTSVVKVIGRR